MVDISEARELLSAAVNTLSDPHDACDFDDSEAAALSQTINDALKILTALSKVLKD